ncbi:MAG: GDP-mannose 4,6-dehydratase [Planctomycetota bacterium]|nr:GDP-mannose 4,6-dehydratase [Planctomycetota bacterium]
MPATRGKAVLITGGAGFIGSHLAERWLKAGARVTVVDDLSTGSWANIQHLAGRARLRALVASAGERELLEQLVPEHDLVYHLASAVGVKLVIDQPVKTIQTIFHATDVVLKVCARFRRPVLLTSTSEVYGKSAEAPFREDGDVVMGPTEKRRWAYACAKALDEFLALAHHHETRLPVFLVRLFNTVGPRQTGRYGMVLPRFVGQALRNRPLTVYGDGSQRRCFCSVRDAVDALYLLPQQPAAAGQVVNVGTQEEVSIEALARRVIKLTRSKSKLEFVPYEQAYGEGFDDMQRRVPDLTRVRKLIGWKPRHKLDDIIRQVAAEMRRRAES